MKARQFYEGLLIELSKENAPAMLLNDFNYFVNKTVNQYINKRYGIYDIDQQTTDDLKVLRMFITCKNPIECSDNGDYEVQLPEDYLHLLNCICVYKNSNEGKCDNPDIIQYAAKRMSSDSWPVIMNDYYNRPLPKRPYFTIISKEKELEEKTTSGIACYDSICKLKCGLSNPKLKEVHIEYLRCPQIIELTREQIVADEDNSQELEFPDYVLQEIMNELVNLVLENNQDPRIQTHKTVTTSIASPTQQSAYIPRMRI